MESQGVWRKTEEISRYNFFSISFVTAWERILRWGNLVWPEIRQQLALVPDSGAAIIGPNAADGISSNLTARAELERLYKSISVYLAVSAVDRWRFYSEGFSDNLGIQLFFFPFVQCSGFIL